VNVPGSVVRAELRRRVWSLAALAVLVAVVVAAVSGALAGAHRTATSIDRFRDWAHASDGGFQSYDDSQLPALRRRLEASPLVERTAERRLVNAFFDHRQITDIAIYSDPADEYGRIVDRVHVLHGRMPRRDEPDAIALNDLAARLLHLGPGAVLETRTWSPKDLQGLFAGNTETAFPGFHGPKVRLRVVGVVRTLDGLTANVQRTSPYGFAGPGFIAAHPGIGVWPAAIYVRTHGGAADFRTLGAQFAKSGAFGTGYPATDEYQTAAQQAADDAASGLVVFALAGALAGAFVVGQAIQRHLLLGAVGLRQLVDLGMTRTQVAIVAGIPLVGAAVVGTVVGLVAAALLSSLLPIGLARRAEISPGIRIDLPILAATGIAIIVLFAGFTLVAGRAAARGGRARSIARTRVPLLQRLVTRVGAPPAVGAGVHLATERNAAAGPVPVRSALIGVSLAVIAVIGATVVARSEAAFTSEPARWGRTWHSEPDAFSENTTQKEIARKLRAVPGVEAVAEYASDTLRVERRDTETSAFSPIVGTIDASRRRGRLPHEDDEIALGERTLRDAHVHIGETVRVRGHEEDQPGPVRMMKVTGTIVTPPGSGNGGALDTGAVVTATAFRSLIPPDEVTSDLVIRYAPGADVGAIERRLSREGLDFNPFTEPQVPGAVRRLSDVRTISVALGWFFVALGVLGLLHTLWVASRRHRREFAVMRVVGMRRAQVGTAVVVAAILLATVAVVIGVPLGVVVGRLVWKGSTDSLGALTDPVTPWLVLVVALPVTVGVAALLAWWPARRAARVQLAASLRTE
jgi:ABC-type lipoprotein release transport system permease subunit